MLLLLSPVEIGRVGNATCNRCLRLRLIVYISRIRHLGYREINLMYYSDFCIICAFLYILLSLKAF